MTFASPDLYRWGNYGNDCWGGERKTVFNKALSVSVVVHAVLLLAFFGLKNIPAVSRSADHWLEVSYLPELTPDSSEPIQQEVVDNSQARMTALPTKSLEDTIPLESSVDNSITGVPSETAIIAPEQKPVALDSSPEIVETGPTETTVPETGGEISAESSLNIAEVERAIESFGNEYREQLRGEWLAECVRFQNKYGTKECDQNDIDAGSSVEQGRAVAAKIFRDAFRDSRQAKKRLKLDQENSRLNALAKEHPELASMAEFRINLNREKIAFFSGNKNTAAKNFVLISQRDNPNLGFIVGGMLQFICKGGECSYDDTGYNKGQAPELESVVPEFELNTPLLNRSQD